MAQPQDKPFRHIIRDRILLEMLRTSKNASSGSASAAGGNWKVLITDAYTLKVISSSCKMPDITEEGISLVEDVAKPRQPQPFMDALYFIQPSQLSLTLFKNDMQGREPLYRRAHVYLSRPLPREHLQLIKDDPQLRSRIAALREMNLEVLTVDMQGFVTDNGDALQTLYGSEISGREYERMIHDMAARLATVFASLKEFPAMRYRAAKMSSAGAGSPQRMRDMVPSKLAAALWDRIMKYKQDLPGFPQKDTCDLLIVDRTLDPVAPFIHDWSYSGLCFDLLPVDGNKYEYETRGADGKSEKKAVLLDEHDPIWLEVRDLFIAEAYGKLKEIFDQISAKTSTKNELSGAELSNLVRSLAQYREQKDKVELHIKISSNLNTRLKAEGLHEVGKLEQGFVFGDPSATFKELSALLKDRGDEMSPYSKLRLLLVYAATHPDKLDPQKLQFWIQLACLGDKEGKAVANLEFLGIPLGSTPAPKAAGMGLSFGGRKSKSGAQRQERKKADEEAYELSRFYPMLQDVLEDMHTAKLSLEDYPYVQEPAGGIPQPGSVSSGSLSASSSNSSLSSLGGGSNQSSSSGSSLTASSFASSLTAFLPGSLVSSTPSSSAPGTPAQAASSSAAPASSGKPSSVRSARKKPGSSQAPDSTASAPGSGSSAGGSSGSFASGSTLASWALRSAGKDGAGPAGTPAGAGLGSGAGTPGTGGASSARSQAASVRGTSARGGGSAGGLASATEKLSLTGGSSSSARGRRLFVFVVGGMTRSEIRVAHLLSQRLNREVIMGSTSLDTPLQFVEKLKTLRKS